MKNFVKLLGALGVFILTSVQLYRVLENAPLEIAPESLDERLWTRTRGLESLVRDTERVYMDEVLPLYADLMSTSQVRDRDRAMLVATLVNRYAREVGVNPRLVVAVIKVENPWLIADTASYAGAVGIMQVMPSVWQGVFPECGLDLTQIPTNICTGVRILKQYLDREVEPALSRALLRYNGCWTTEGCSAYSTKVLGSEPWNPYN